MSSPLALGAVSAVLRNLLDDGLVQAAPLPGAVTVSALAPDQIKLDAPLDPPQLNLFLYQVTPNAAWRNQWLPARSAAGERLSNAPLALDLHYLVTAYGKTDFQAEILLGYAMHLMHERGVLDRPAIRRALQPGTLDLAMLPPEYQVLSAADLADQIEALRITPHPMPLDELSKLWTAIKGPLRPSAAYQVSVVLIDPARPARSPLPVLSRGRIDPLTQRDQGVMVQADLLPPVPTLDAAWPANRQLVARLGESISLSGSRLAGANPVARLVHRLRAEAIELPVNLHAAGDRAEISLPADAAAQASFLPGLWQLSLRMTPAGELLPRETNAIGLALAADPVLVADGALGLPAASASRAGVPPVLSVSLHTRPPLRSGQRAQLILDGHSAEAAAPQDPADPLVFHFPGSVPAGVRWVRLRVDGIDSPLVRRDGPTPVFDPSQQLTVP